MLEKRRHAFLCWKLSGQKQTLVFFTLIQMLFDKEFEDYTGSNAYLFQPAVSILVAAIHDFALKKKQSFILDGTLSNFEIADENISRSLKRKRHVQILYVYLNPEKAWEFVRAREERRS